MPDSLPTPVVCLHSSAASGRQWRRLVADDAAAGHHRRWHTPDLFGHGGRPDWPALRPSELVVEANGVLAGLPLAADQGFHLVGHSYGGAVALQLALQHPERVRSLTLYEPVAFGLLAARGDGEPGWQEIADVAATLGAALERGDDFGAARGFCAYWQGRDVWPELDVAQQLRIADAMPTVRRHFEALFAAQWTDRQLAALRMPVQLICGSATRTSARRAAQALAARLPQARLEWLAGAGHMAPITEPGRVNPRILESLGALQWVSAA